MKKQSIIKDNKKVNNININAQIIKKTGLKSAIFLSSLFGSFIATVYFILILILSGSLKFEGVKEGLFNSLEAFPILWILFLIIIFLNFKTVAQLVRNKRKSYQIREKMHLAFVFFVYFCITIVLIVIAKVIGLNVFYTFVALSTWSIGALFADSMDIALNNLEKLEGDLK